MAIALQIIRAEAVRLIRKLPVELASEAAMDNLAAEEPVSDEVA